MAQQLQSCSPWCCYFSIQSSVAPRTRCVREIIREVMTFSSSDISLILMRLKDQIKIVLEFQIFSQSRVSSPVPISGRWLHQTTSCHTAQKATDVVQQPTLAVNTRLVLHRSLFNEPPNKHSPGKGALLTSVCTLDGQLWGVVVSLFSVQEVFSRSRIVRWGLKLDKHTFLYVLYILMLTHAQKGGYDTIDRQPIEAGRYFD